MVYFYLLVNTNVSRTLTVFRNYFSVLKYLFHNKNLNKRLSLFLSSLTGIREHIPTGKVYPEYS